MRQYIASPAMSGDAAFDRFIFQIIPMLDPFRREAAMTMRHPSADVVRCVPLCSALYMPRMLSCCLTFLQMRLANRRPIPRIWHKAYITLRAPFTLVFNTRNRP